MHTDGERCQLSTLQWPADTEDLVAATSELSVESSGRSILVTRTFSGQKGWENGAG